MTTKYLPYVFIQGKTVPVEKAVVPIMTNALQYGTGVFGGLRAYESADKKTIAIFRLDDHIKRFVNSVKILGVSLPYTEDALKAIVFDLLKKNKPTSDIYIRIFAYAASTNLSPNLERDNEFDFAVYMTPLKEYLPLDKGLSVTISSWRRISDNAIPSRGKISGGYINSALARQDATRSGFDEAILLTENGHVAEGSAENLFLVKHGVLITPPESDDILEGITRRTVLQLAQDLDIKTEIRSIDKTELFIADEVFFSGTAVQIAWIGQIDRRIIRDGKQGPVAKALQEKFFRVVRGQEPQYQQWLTPLPTATTASTAASTGRSSRKSR